MEASAHDPNPTFLSSFSTVRLHVSLGLPLLLLFSGAHVIAVREIASFFIRNT